ncbi:MAG: endonuclease/exonuclease/phosphatase family protein, partial [Opitutaceae bacterium]
MTSRRLRIVTLNTWKNEGDHPARVRAMGEGLRALQPDIVLLQEVFRTGDGVVDTGRSLAGALGLALAHAPARAKTRRWAGREVSSEAGLAVLARGEIGRRDRLSLPSDERGGERIALFADVTCEGGAKAFVCCTHLSHLRGDT